MEALIEAATGEELVDEEAVGAGGAVAEEAGKIRVPNVTDGVHLRSKFAEALEGG